jgi:hypothetical protein
MRSVRRRTLAGHSKRCRREDLASIARRSGGAAAHIAIAVAASSEAS